MQIKPTNFLHYASNFCVGYKNYLNKKRQGKIFSFNWNFFFMGVFWFIYHRMYKEFAVSIFIVFYLSFLFSKNYLSIELISFIFTFIYLIITLSSHYLYEKHLDMKLELASSDPFKKIRPYNFIISFLIFIVATITLFMFYSFLFKFIS